MSCFVGIGSGSYKEVKDIQVGVGGVAKNVNYVKRWDGAILWQRKAKTIELTASNTRFTIDPSSYSWSDATGYHSYTNCHPTPYSVSSRLEPNTIDYNNGDEWVTLSKDTHFSVTYSSNTDSGRLPASGTTSGTSSVTGEMYITGIESAGYSGTITKTFPITYNYTYVASYYYVAFNGNGNTGGSMSTQTIWRDVATALSANGFTHNTLTFKGWSSSSSGSVEYSNKQKVTNLAESNATKQLYAIWGAKPAMSSITILKTAHYAGTESRLHLREPVYSKTFIGDDFSITFDDGTTVIPSYDGEYGLTWKVISSVDCDSVTYYDGSAIASSKLPAYAWQGNLKVTSDGSTYAAGTLVKTDWYYIVYNS